MQPRAASFTPALLRRLISMRGMFRRRVADLSPGGPRRSRFGPWFTHSRRLQSRRRSRVFIKSIRARDIDALRNYAHDCVDIAYQMTVGFHLPLITIALYRATRLAAALSAHCPSTCSSRKRKLDSDCRKFCSTCFPVWSLQFSVAQARHDAGAQDDPERLSLERRSFTRWV